MYALLGLLAFFVIIEIAALTGHVADSRDGRDWTTSTDARGARRPFHLPSGWRSQQ